jgi:hypothetical protein
MTMDSLDHPPRHLLRWFNEIPVTVRFQCATEITHGTPISERRDLLFGVFMFVFIVQRL